MGMNLRQQEDYIKKLIEEDINNPEVYLRLRKLTEVFLRRKKVCRYAKDYEDLAHTIATDIYMKMYQGVRITYLLGYLEKVYRKYAFEYYEETNGSHLSYEETIGTSLLNQKPSSFVFDAVNNKVYLERISAVIDETMQEVCKYDAWSSAFLNLKLSLTLTMLRGERVNFHLDSEQEAYLQILDVKLKSKISQEGY